MPDIFPNNPPQGLPIGTPDVVAARRMAAHRGIALAGYGKLSHPDSKVDLPNLMPTSYAVPDATHLTKYSMQPQAGGNSTPQPVKSTDVWQSYLNALAKIKDSMPGAP
jgi:hypothetical protein